MGLINVPPRAWPAPLARLRVGQPVSGGHATDWNVDAVLQLGGIGAAIGSARYNGAFLSAAPFVTSLAYARSPGAQALYVAVELATVTTAGTAVTLTLSWSSGNPMHFVSNPQHLDGTSPITVSGPNLRNPAIAVAIVDVTGQPTNGTIDDLVLTVASTGVTQQNLFTLHAAEVPLADADPDDAAATEVGCSSGFGYSEGRIMDGSVVSGTGFARLWDAHDQCRYARRQHAQWTTIDLNAAQTSSTTFANPDWSPLHLYWSNTYVPIWTLRARRLYSTSDLNQYTFRVVYRCDAATGGKFRLIVSGTNYDLTVPQALAWTAATLFPAKLPTGAANQEATLQVQALTNDGTKPMKLRNWALIENEP